MLAGPSYTGSAHQRHDQATVGPGHRRAAQAARRARRFFGAALGGGISGPKRATSRSSAFASPSGST